MTMPRSGQTVHLMNHLDVCRVLWKMRSREGRNTRELALYTTDDLRRMYQSRPLDGRYLRDGVISEVQLVAVIRWRIWWARFGYGLLLTISIASAFFAYFAWRDPVSAPIPVTITTPLLAAPTPVPSVTAPK